MISSILYDASKLTSQLDILARELVKNRSAELDIWRKAAVPVVASIKSKTPIGKVDKFLYSSGKKGAPIKPGTLRNSIMVLPTIKNAVVIGSFTKQYASYRQLYALHFFMIEYGTMFFQGFGFMRRGLSGGQGEAFRIMVREYDKLIQNTVKKVGST